VLEAIDTVLEKARKTDLHVGASVGFDADLVKEWFEKGVQWFALGEDVGHMADGFAKVVSDTRAIGAKR
jgi:2-keto-3-deoxy-L-rhamnonate aldolase RhmA